MLNFKQPITTRKGDKVKFYEIYSDRIHGAYLIKDIWAICCWSLPNGVCITPYLRDELDLINNDWVDVGT